MFFTTITDDDWERGWVRVVDSSGVFNIGDTAFVVDRESGWLAHGTVELIGYGEGDGSVGVTIALDAWSGPVTTDAAPQPPSGEV